MATQIFKQILKTRALNLRLIENLSLEQINTIPTGFRNNIIWNLGHLAVTTPALCYQRTGVEPNKLIPFQEKYAKDTVPTGAVDQVELDAIKTNLLASIKQLESDYEAGLFATIIPFATSTYQLELTTIEDVLLTTLMHDNLHLGYCIALLKNITQ